MVRRFFSILVISFGLVQIARANGVYGNGTGARSMAMGGADVAWASDPLGAMAANPAGLGFLTRPELNLGLQGGILQGHFEKHAVSSGNLDGAPGALPTGAFALPLGKWPVVVGISFVPQSMLLDRWRYTDPRGGLGGVSYGSEQEKSELLLLRSALGLAGQVTSDLSIGASVGLLYNKNELFAPYIFQHIQGGNAGLNGAKTLLDLKTEGLAWNAQVGLIYRITPDLQFGVSYESESNVVSTGDATGDPSLQFGLPRGTLPFHYDATVTNTFPQQVSTGFSWKFQPQWRVALQVDWIDWSDAFHNLPLSFRNGSNPAVNGALGSKFSESVPLNWRDQFVYRLGLEYEVTRDLTLRAGYCYGGSPVPGSTLTPLNGAILEHTLTAGAAYRWKQFEVALAYQYYLPNTQSIGESELRSGEYSNSSLRVSAHELTVTTSVHF